MTYRVIQWGTGSIGKTCLRQVIDHPDLELVGLRVYSSSKDGRDAGEIARRDPTGVIATRDVARILATDADIVIHTPRIQTPFTFHDKDIIALLESGKNVITTVGHQYPSAHGPAHAAHFEAAGRTGGSTFFGTGVNPGFIVDRLLVAATGMCTQLDGASAREVVECSMMREPGFVFDVMGMGRAPQEIELIGGPLAGLYNEHFLEVMVAFADGVGVSYDRVEPDHRVVTTPRELTVAAGVIPAGTVAATEWRWHGLVDGRRFFTLSINWIMDWDLPGYRDGPRDHWQLEITGKPGIYLKMGLVEPDEPGVKTSAVQYAVAAPVIRAIPDVCAAAPGLFAGPVFGAFFVESARSVSGGAMIGVLGATGGIGREVTVQLLERGESVRALVRDPARARELLGDGPSYSVADLADPATLPAAFAGLTALLLVSPVGPSMVAWQRSAIEAAVPTGVEHVVRISSIAVGDPLLDMQFARWHAELDTFLTDSGLTWTVLRPSNFMRNLLGFAGGIRTSGTLRAPLGAGRMCFVDDADIAAVAVAALTDPAHRGQAYVLTGSQWLDYHAVAGLIGAAVGAPVSYEPVPIETARAAWRRAGHDEWFVDDLSRMYAELAVRDVSPVTSDIATVLGREPRNLEQFLVRHASEFRPEGGSAQ